MTCAVNATESTNTARSIPDSFKNALSQLNTAINSRNKAVEKGLAADFDAKVNEAKQIASQIEQDLKAQAQLMQNKRNINDTKAALALSEITFGNLTSLQSLINNISTITDIPLNKNTIELATAIAPGQELKPVQVSPSKRGAQRKPAKHRRRQEDNPDLPTNIRIRYSTRVEPSDELYIH